MSDKAFAMPRVEVSDIVLWYDGGNRSMKPRAAIVTQVNMHMNQARTLNLNIFDPQNYNTMIRDGVRHLDDPDTKTNERYEAGCWEATPQHKRLADLADKVAVLMHLAGPKFAEVEKELKKKAEYDSKKHTERNAS